MSENEFSVNEFIVREIGYPGAIKQEVVGELVRCKDCVNYRPDKAGNYCRTFGRLRMNDFFCAYGERSEE